MPLSKVTDWLKEKSVVSLNLNRLANLNRTWLGSHAGLKGLSLLVVLTLLLVVFSQARCAIVSGGAVVAVAADRGAAKSAVHNYIDALEKKSGLPVSVKDGVKYRPTWRQADSRAEVSRLLAQKLDCRFTAAGIYVAGKPVAALKDQAAAAKVMDNLLALYNHGGQWEAKFKQDVAVEPLQAERADLMTVTEAVDYLRFGGRSVKTYQVANGDNLYDIARVAELPLEELVLANPGLDPAQLQVGQEIIISRPAPLVDVTASYQDTRREEILFRVQERKDDSLYLGERKVIQTGQSGEREVAYQVTLENGVEISQKKVAERVLAEPVQQVVLKGDRQLVASRGGNGRLAWPAGGGIASPFGSRWGRPHLGVDIEADQGNPVVAAEDGVVLSAGYDNSGYGLCIDIDHGGGVVTRYAHLSAAVVASGQTVERGQLIGRAGATGNATGPHLHFEVIVNGVQKDPALFI